MVKNFQKPYKNGYIRVKVSIENNRFSVTGSVYEPFVEGDREVDCVDFWGEKYSYAYGGCIHDDISEAYPILKPIIELHLNDHNGMPMYCIENGYYHYKCGNISAFSHHFMLDKNLTELIVDSLNKHTKGEDYRKLVLSNHVLNILAPLWEQKAIQAMEVYNTLYDKSIIIANDLYEHSAE
jgi:hypothetical protein